MALSTDLLRQVYDQSHGRCECHMACGGHGSRCDQPVQWEAYGQTWQVLSINGTDLSSDSPADYFVLCSDPLQGGCYEAWLGLDLEAE